MIYYIPGLTFQEQIQVWLNSTDGEEYNLGKYLEVMIESMEDEDSPAYQKGYDKGYDVGYDDGESNGYSNGYADGLDALLIIER